MMRTLQLALVLCVVSVFGLGPAEGTYRIGIEAGAGVDGINLGDTEEQVLEELGEPDFVLPQPDGLSTSYRYEEYGMSVHIDPRDTTVRSVMVTAPYPATCASTRVWRWPPA